MATYHHHTFKDASVGPRVSVNPILAWQFEEFARNFSEFYTVEDFLQSFSICNGKRIGHGDNVNNKMYADFELFVKNPSDKRNYRFHVDPHFDHWIDQLQLDVAKEFGLTHCRLHLKDGSNLERENWAIFTHRNSPIIFATPTKNVPLTAIPSRPPPFHFLAENSNIFSDVMSLKCRFKKRFRLAYLSRLSHKLSKNKNHKMPRSKMLRKTSIASKVFYTVSQDPEIYRQTGVSDMKKFWAAIEEEDPTRIITNACHRIVSQLNGIHASKIDHFPSSREADLLNFLCSKIKDIDFFSSSFALAHSSDSKSVEYDSEPDEFALLSHSVISHRPIARLVNPEDYFKHGKKEKKEEKEKKETIYNCKDAKDLRRRKVLCAKHNKSFFDSVSHWLRNVTGVQSIIIAPVGADHGVNHDTIDNLFTTNVTSTNFVPPPLGHNDRPHTLIMKSGTAFDLTSDNLIHKQSGKSVSIAEIYAHPDNELGSSIVIATNGNPLP